MKILVMNGPNLNFLGIREPDIYGKQDYAYLMKMLEDYAAEKNFELETYQSNHEGALIDRIQQAYYDKVDGIVINPGAYTHYSYAIHDALASVSMKKVEIHISNVNERESFRHVSVTLPACDAQVVGEGLKGYLHAIDIILAGGEAE
ncbi:MAG: type II 3-dehydroquinate dehydratase [Lachnospiraceae bacterium]